MNAQRRKAIATIKDELEAIKERLSDISGEEESAKDNLPESFMEKMDEMDTNISTINDVICDIENAVENLSEIA